MGRVLVLLSLLNLFLISCGSSFERELLKAQNYAERCLDYEQKLESQGYPDITLVYGSETQNLLLTVKEDGLWVSYDEGVTWQESMDGIRDAQKPIYDIVEDTNKIFYIATGDGVYRSLNSGKSWERFSEGLPYEHRTDTLTPIIYRLSLNSIKGELYSRVALNGFGLYKTSLDKPNWYPIGYGLPPDSITIDISHSPKNDSIYIINGCSGVIMIGEFDADAMGVFRGRDKGKSEYEWEKEQLPSHKKYETIRRLEVDPNSGEVYACSLLGLYKKSLHGWELAFDERFVSSITFGYSQRALVVTAFNQVFIRRNNTWQPIKNKPWGEYALVQTSCFFKGSILVGTNEGLFVSRDNGNHWEKIKLSHSDTEKSQ